MKNPYKEAVRAAAEARQRGSWPCIRRARDGYESSSSNALAARKSAVSKPSVNEW